MSSSLSVWLTTWYVLGVFLVVVNNGQNTFDDDYPLRGGQSLLEAIQSFQHDILEEVRSMKKEMLPLNNLTGHLRTQSRLLQGVYSSLFLPRDCKDVFAKTNSRLNQVYRVYPDAKKATDVFCDMTTPGGPWTVFQRRKDGSVDFNISWKNYTDGFGNLNREFWLGNENLYLLTSNGRCKLRIEIEDMSGNKRYAEYSSFSISNGNDYYRLNVSGYSGNAGDSLTYHNRQYFSTRDADRDSYSSLNCAASYRAGWWYNTCIGSSLNGLYLSGTYSSGTCSSYQCGITWNAWYSSYYSLKATEMKISRIE